MHPTTPVAGRSARSVPLAIASAVALLLAVPESAAQVDDAVGAQRSLDFLRAGACSRIADPKLEDGGVDVSYFLAPGPAPYAVTVTVLAGATPIATVFQGPLPGAAQPHAHRWDGLDDQGRRVDPGDYTVRVEATRGRTLALDYDVTLVRLGITEIEAQPSADPVNEWQMVYFRRPSTYAFYATPAIHEFHSVADRGETSDLDLDDGSPRPPPLPHDDTAVPVMEPTTSGGWKYDNDEYNYPLCYEKGALPLFEVTFGDSCTSSSGARIGCNYPVPGFQIRARATDSFGAWTSSNDDLQPGGTATFLGPALPGSVTRTERPVVWTWQARPVAGGEWQDVPGRLETRHRFYTNWLEPRWAAGASGTQYAGPWVEVSEYYFQWQQGLGIVPDTEARVVETLMKGFFGQNGPLLTAIEDVHYDCPSEGGDGGATHYYQFGSRAVELSRLLHLHDNGPFVNCSDVASSTSGMLAMLGMPDMEMVRLGAMTLKCIWGIGTPDYTLDLWSNGSHGFSYHHIITRNHGSNVSDSCMWLDDDGDPEHYPGLPGYNHDRPWNVYNDLSSYNNVSRSYDPLPKLW